MTIRKAQMDDLPKILSIYQYARDFMRKTGNPTQWGDGYPSREQIESDIQRGVSYIVEHEGQPCATFVFIIGEDPTYAYIEDGQWLDDTLPYGTIHRIASNGQKRGIFPFVLNWCSAQCSNIRIDTHEDNKRMIHLIEQANFTRCGIIYTRDYSPRMAYQSLDTAIIKD